MTGQLTILATKIRQDADGRYCLNDCHKASGADPSKAPGQWLRNDQAQALAAELTDVQNHTSPISSVKGGHRQGTYVAKEMIYAYAMWISPTFHLRVIRAFDALVTGAHAAAPVSPHVPFDPSNAIAIGLSFFPNLGEGPKQAFVANVFEVALGRPVLPAPVVERRMFSATEVGKRLGMSANMVGRIANRFGLKTADFGEFRLTSTPGGRKQVEQFHYNENGIEMLGRVK